MKYCAFLRGVNVKGTNMKMVDVCKVFSEAGMQNVASVLASGNILFSSDKNSLELKETLEKAMSNFFNYDCNLFLKNEQEVSKIMNQNPFEKADHLHIYSFVGIEGIENILLQYFEDADKFENEKGEVVGKYFYWQVPKNCTLESSFGKILGKKELKDKMTSRNNNTIEKIVHKLNSI